MNGGCALVMDFASRRILHAEGDPHIVLAPGSTIKPFSLTALMESGMLPPTEKFVCPVELSIDGRSFGCVHPPMATPITAATAIAYSCNNFVSRVARRFQPGQLSRHLARFGFAAPRLKPAQTLAERQLQALGAWGVLASPEELLFAWRTLAASTGGAILEGLEGAVEYGTAQRAKLPGVNVAGKTGTAPGNAAWFAGFAPSRSPKVVAVVLTGGKSGGADAAPLGARLIAEALR